MIKLPFLILWETHRFLARPNPFQTRSPGDVILSVLPEDIMEAPSEHDKEVEGLPGLYFSA